jgi:predicted site-specific integrase-resolvase
MSRRKNASPIESRRSLKLNDYCDAYGPSRSTAYNWIRSGLLPDVKVAGSRFIPIDAAEKLHRSKKEPAE